MRLACVSSVVEAVQHEFGDGVQGVVMSDGDFDAVGRPHTARGKMDDDEGTSGVPHLWTEVERSLRVRQMRETVDKHQNAPNDKRRS